MLIVFFVVDIRWLHLYADLSILRPNPHQIKSIGTFNPGILPCKDLLFLKLQAATEWLMSVLLAEFNLCCAVAGMKVDGGCFLLDCSCVKYSRRG